MKISVRLLGQRYLIWLCWCSSVGAAAGSKLILVKTFSEKSMATESSK